MKNKNDTNPQDVWIKISKGSLVIEAEIDGNPNVNWPSRDEMKEIAQTILNSDIGGLATTPARGANTMAERVQSIIDPWQDVNDDPWARRKAKQEEAQERGHNESERGHGGRGFRPVSEKDLQLTQLHGSQDSHNKIPYLKWAKRLKEFIEVKGKKESHW